MKEIITLNDYLTSSGKYPERAKSPEINMKLIKNANILLDKVNQLLSELNKEKVEITSGFRTAAANKDTPNAAAKSNHMICCAVDLIDNEQQEFGNKLKVDFELNGENSLLVKCGLYMEDLSHTKGKNTNWVHLQFVQTKSGKRIFIP